MEHHGRWSTLPSLRALLALPVLALYELGIIMSRIMLRRTDEAKAASGDESAD